MINSRVFNKALWTKPLFAWYLYDFANSFLVINLSLYFSQWVVVDKELTDFWFALPFIAATGILVFLSTYVGERGDIMGTHRKIFIWTTIAAILSGPLIVLGGRYSSSPLLAVTLALLFYGFFQFFLQLALVPYTAFLKYLAPSDAYGAVSGLGFAFNQLGYIAGIFLTYPIVSGWFTFFGTDRLAPLIPASIVFLLFALPSFFYLRQKASFSVIADTSFLKSFWRNLKESRKYPGTFPFLISFYFFSDATASITLFAAIYLQNVFGIADALKAKVFLFVIIGDVLGSYIGGILADTLGYRKVLISSLISTVIVIVPVALAKSVSSAVILFPVFGFIIGVVYAASRAYLASLIPAGESGKFFGLYTFSERFASIVGPAVWGLIIWLLASIFPWNYRIAALAMAVLIAIGIVPLIWKGSARATIPLQGP